MAKTYLEKVTMDSSFKPLPTDTDPASLQGKVHIIKVTKYQKPTVGKAKPAGSTYIATDGTKTVHFDEDIAKRARKSKSGTIDHFFNQQVQQNPDKVEVKLNKGRNFRLRNILLVTSIIAVLVTGFIIAVQVSEKNFTGKTIKVSIDNYKDIKAGDFVELDLPLLDLYTIEVTETTTTYGVKTGESKYAGNSYALSFVFVKDEKEKAPTFIYRFDPNSKVGLQIEAQKEAERPIVEKVTGEVKNLGAIEQVDSGEQVIPYFNSSVEKYYKDNWSEPTWLVDGRVTPGNLNMLILSGGIAVLISIATIGATVIFWRKSGRDLEAMVG